MANIMARTLSIKNIVKIKHFSNFTGHPVMNSLLNTLNTDRNCYHNQVTLIWNNRKSNVKYYSTDSKNTEKKKDCKEFEDNNYKKLSLFQKFKMMYRDYWYVLLPVHICTSAVWFGGFYFMAKSGIDIAALLESWHVSERIVNPLRDSSMGYFAVSYALYKVATPARYTVTLGGTTISINYLKKWGYIKPVPSSKEMKQIYEKQKETLAKSMKETKEGIKERKENLIESVRGAKEGIIGKKDDLIETLEETKKGLKVKKSHFVESVKGGKPVSKIEENSNIKNKKF